MEHSSTNKLFKWEGWKKELFWIILFLLILFMAYGYYKDKQELQKITDTECYKQCYFEESVAKMVAENPGLQFDCNYETYNCEVYGVYGAVPKFIGGLNITLKGDTNNSF